jgi:hypothetical protein
VKGVIRVLKQAQRRMPPEPGHEGLQQPEIRERIPTALEEQHRDANLSEVLAPLVRGSAGGMQGEAEKRQRANPGKRRRGLRLRRHSPAERPPARDEGKASGQSGGLRDRGANGCMGEARRIRSFRALFHERELVAEGRDLTLRQSERDGFQERVAHARARAMGEDVTGASPRGSLEKARDAALLADRERDRLRAPLAAFAPLGRLR